MHRILSELSGNFPLPILVVQHITPGFVDGFADWLRGSCAPNVSMAVDGRVQTVRQPSIPIGRQCVPVGGDRRRSDGHGARWRLDGLLSLHKFGGHVIAQDEASSIVFGMPGTAIAANVVHDVLPLKDIAAKLLTLVGA